MFDFEETLENPINSKVMEYFEYEHLPETLQEISKPFCELAFQRLEVFYK